MADDTMHSNPDGLKLSGRVPPAMQQAIREVRKEKTGDKDTPHSSQARPTGSGKLEGLIEGLKSHIFEEIKLPSEGVFYDGTDGPRDGKLRIRPMEGAEEQILATSRWVKKGQAINMIFQRCLEESFKPEDFLSVDRTYLLIWLRGISYGHGYEVEVKCPECSRKFSTIINLDSLHLTSCPADYRPPLEDVLPKSGYKFNYRLSKGKDETQIQDYRDRQLKMFGDGGADDTLIYRTVMLLNDIEGLKDKNELMMLLKKLPIQDVAYMRNVVTDPPFGVDTKCEIVCPGDLAEFEVDLPLEANFFFPRQRKREKTQA
jgi:hypothetical protein